MNDNTNILAVSVYFVWQWWEEHYQKTRGRPDTIDMDWLDETYLGRQCFLHQHLGQSGVGSANPVLDRSFVSRVMPFHTMIVPVILGMEIAIQEIGGYTWKSMPPEQLQKLEPVDIAQTAVGDLIAEQKQERLNRYGLATQMIDLASVSNNAFMLRGVEFYSDLIVDQALAHHYLQVLAETMCMTYRFVTGLFGPIKGFPLGNCNVTMMSPQLYAKMIRQYDIQCVEYAASLAGKPPHCDLHHCDVKTEPFAQAYSEIPGLHSLQGSYESDIAQIQRVLPDVLFSAMISPVDLLNKPAAQLHHDIDHCIAAGANDLAIWNIDPQFGPARVRELFSLITKIAARCGKTAKFTVVPLTWEEMAWEFPTYL